MAVCIDTRDGAGRERLCGVMQYGRQRGWRMMLVRRTGAQGAREVARLRPRGIIAYIGSPALVRIARSHRIPLVDTALGEAGAPFVVTLDSDAVGRLAADHLMELSLTNFAYCGVTYRVASAQRRESFARHLASRGYRLHTFSQSVAEGESAMQPLVRWLLALPRPAGVLCFDDKLGERVLAACRWADVDVPSQVAVLGVGDDEVMCEVSWPPLSSIASPTQRLGSVGAKLLDDAMNGRAIPQRTLKVQPIGVTERRSTDTVAVQDALVRSAVLWIRQRAAGPVGVDDIARALGVSRRTLDRRFPAATGRSVHDEVRAARMKMARRLLANTSVPIARIAEQCGYTTAASFSRTFHQQTGCWPSHFRIRGPGESAMR